VPRATGSSLRIALDPIASGHRVVVATDKFKGSLTAAAAGGTAFAALAYLGAELRSGEGSIDAQTLQGKVPRPGGACRLWRSPGAPSSAHHR
jgi:glycerate kinase